MKKAKAVNIRQFEILDSNPVGPVTCRVNDPSHSAVV